MARVQPGLRAGALLSAKGLLGPERAVIVEHDNVRNELRRLRIGDLCHEVERMDRLVGLSFQDGSVTAVCAYETAVTNARTESRTAAEIARRLRTKPVIAPIERCSIRFSVRQSSRPLPVSGSV